MFFKDQVLNNIPQNFQFINKNKQKHRTYSPNYIPSLTSYIPYFKTNKSKLKHKNNTFIKMRNSWPKSVFYRDDGTGRDSYIALDNGGYYPPNNPMPEFPVSSMRSYRALKPITL